MTSFHSYHQEIVLLNICFLQFLGMAQRYVTVNVTLIIIIIYLLILLRSTMQVNCCTVNNPL